MALVEALHGRATMARVRAPWPRMGSSPDMEGRGKRGEGQGRRIWLPWREGTKGSAWGRVALDPMWTRGAGCACVSS
jgi:hypothetical protein